MAVVQAPRLWSRSPTAALPTAAQLDALASHVTGAARLLAITGAGISTHSGIPDYRSPNGSYSRGHRPIQHMEFVSDAKARRRYWARSFIGWDYFSRAVPNAAHAALAEMERKGWLRGGLLTQNVDGLHQAAGSSCIDLHGRIDQVECLDCGTFSERAQLQERLRAINTSWLRQTRLLDAPPAELRADGDSELTEDQAALATCRLTASQSPKWCSQ